ncbi:MAG: 50S ribosomal protein L28 [Oscillospiraceae bacterium]|jgi:large subunit ribosomal protein L28|nr:50S ribosomal protein L28 [Oscillospiraceae bacterium]
MMATCELCDKKMNVAKRHVYRSSYVTKRSLRKQYPNLQKIRIAVGGATKRIYICTRCLKAQKVQRA